ncbi:MAG TPA: LPS-assembly protein LptD [Bauldia sp.]|nr:LPS-assembly protein LptD [Bauldia sp.]
MRVAVFGRVWGRLIGGSPLRFGALALAGFMMALAPTAASAAVTLPVVKTDPKSPMLVEADQLVYDYDKHTVSAVGNVKLYYSGYTLEAEKVTYIEPTHRLIAMGSVKLTDPTGIATYADHIDITDNFSDGFVQSLRVDTPDRTHFAAERAERAGGETTTFVNGVYTACEPCKDHPERPPLWQIKAKKIIINHKEKMIYFRSAALEFLGVPIAYVPYFSTVDPSVKRKTGLLAPSFGYADAVGWSITAPYYVAFAPNYDLTLTPSYYTKQGFLGEIEWRQRLSNGFYTVRVAGISQNDPAAFLKGNSGTYAQRTFRGALRTTGNFDINQYWSFGWDGTLSTDRTFTRNYSVLNNDSQYTLSYAHLTGMSDRNYLDLRAMYFQALTDDPTNPLYDQQRQAAALPVFDYSRTFASPVLGGELKLTSNVANIVRKADDPFTVPGDPTTYYHGLSGDFLRGTVQLDWQKQIIGPLGTVIKPFAYLRGDLFSVNADGAVPSNFAGDGTTGRFMPAVGAELSWPVLVAMGGMTHVFEPIAQIVVRPDEPAAGTLPNDDSQSMVFDASRLFALDKFSGYDRVEGGTRLNAGIRYTGDFGNGMTASALFGQSYQLAGKNSYAQPDVADAGKYSGLETKTSDFVGSLVFDTGLGARFFANARFDDKSFAMERGEVAATTNFGPITASARYLYLKQDPNAGVVVPQSVVGAEASVEVLDNWRLFGSIAYDVKSTNLARDSFGIAFDNSCLTLSVAYNETRNSDIPSRNLTFRVLLRTLGDTSVTADLNKLK